MLFAVGLGGIPALFMIIVAGILGFITLFFLCHFYQTILIGTATGGHQVHWPSDTIIDMVSKVPLVLWLALLSCAPGMIVGAALSRSFPFASIVLPLAVFWLVFPLAQCSSLFGTSNWMPFSPVAVAKMSGKSGVTIGFYLRSALVIALVCGGFYLCFWPNPLKGYGPFPGGVILAICVFVYARLLGRMAFAVSFHGQKVRKESKPLPQYSAESEVPRPKKRKKTKTRKVTEEGYSLDERDEEPAAPEPEPEFVPPKFAWDDDPVTSYDAKAPEVEIKKAVDPKIFEVKDSEMKLIDRRDIPKEPTIVWNSEVWSGLAADPKTLANAGLASAFLIACGLLVDFIVDLVS